MNDTPLYATQSQIQSRLLNWAQDNLRDLPWRHNRTPYRVWVSEIMLQQTQVQTVIPYFKRWMERFPTIESLARADLDQVLKCWEGLGYYARCRNLHRAAQKLVHNHDGQLPSERRALLSLPGIGPYTVGAVLSLAFGQDAAVLDGNVRRVLSRLFGLADDPKAKTTREKLWHLAETLVPAGQAGRFNEALMDLGATICTPRAPRCSLCPLRDTCRGYASGDPEAYPPSIRRAPTPHYTVTAGVIWRDDDYVLIAQRPLDGLLGGLWEFPGGKQEPGETLRECLKRELYEELLIQVSVGPELITVNHAFTHFRVTLHAFECQYLSKTEPQAIDVNDWRWVTLNELDQYAFPVMDQKIIAALGAKQPRLPYLESGEDGQ
ncbi:MAG: A/G-specific adenine glycosylase [Anaerolineae bacterium]|nr:A/G-specific adenine glycosylase [Anaerolineae bacterium]